MEKNRDRQAKKSKKKQSKPAQELKSSEAPAGAIPDYAGLTGDPRQLDALVADSRLTTIQRQESATQIGRLKGNAYLSTLLQEKLEPRASVAPNQVQREDSTPPGTPQSTDFGTYWVVPDDTNQSYVGVIGEQITESAFAILQEVWSKLQSGSGNLVISEKDEKGKSHAGFKSNILNQLVKLISQPTGRSVVINLMSGSKLKVTIRPTAGKLYGGGNAIRVGGDDALEKADGKAGKGSGTIIQIDPSLTDDDVKVHDAEGKNISDPVFIILGHEMIHAQHNRVGRNKRSQKAKSKKYTNLEEEQTVATGPTTENDLRSEHGLKARKGSGGSDTRPGL